MMSILGWLLLFTLHLRIKAAIYEREEYKTPETKSPTLDKVLNTADVYVLPVVEDAFGCLLVGGGVAQFVAHRPIQGVFIGLSAITTTSRYVIKYKIYIGKVSEETATGLDSALIVADKYVLSGLEFALICQPVRAVTFSIAKTLKRHAPLQLAAGNVIRSKCLSVGAKLVKSSLVYTTSVVRDLVHISIDYFMPSRLRLGSTLVEDTCKEVSIIAFKMLGLPKPLGNLAGEFTREASGLVVPNEANSPISWSGKPVKAIAKTLHQYFEKYVCVARIGDHWGYIACGWTRQLFYEVSTQAYTKLYDYLFQSPGLSLPCMDEKHLQLTNYGHFFTNHSSCPAIYYGSSTVNIPQYGLLMGVAAAEVCATGEDA